MTALARNEMEETLTAAETGFPATYGKRREWIRMERNRIMRRQALRETVSAIVVVALLIGAGLLSLILA